MRRRDFMKLAGGAVLTAPAARTIRQKVSLPTSKPMLLASVPSDSDPSRTYDVRKGRDGNVYCTCPAWRFQRKPVAERTCKHIDRLAAAIARTA